MNRNNSLAAVVLAAGKGKRMKSQKINKVALSLAGKPMILYTIDLLKDLKVDPILVVVGFAKESIMKLLRGKVIFCEQKKRLGTAHALSCALKMIPQTIQNVLVLQGDDSALYNPEILEKLLLTHYKTGASFTFLTIEIENPTGLGRVLRNKKGDVLAVVEEKDATGRQRKIREINPACYVFKLSFLEKYLPKVKKSPVTGEYYLTSLIDISTAANEKITTLAAGPFVWRGVNTKDELEEAEKLFTRIKNA